MKISDLIAELERHRDLHGDVGIRYSYGEILCDVDRDVIYFDEEAGYLLLDADYRSRNNPIVMKLTRGKTVQVRPLSQESKCPNR